MKTIKGSCLCGEVRFEINAEIKEFRYCYCPRCQKVTGSAHVSNIFIEPKYLKWTKGEMSVKRYDLPEAKSFATAFCKECGSPVPHMTRSGSAFVVPAGSLDEDPGIKPQSIIYWDQHAPWYVDPNQLPKEKSYTI
jgi:hypothetical protein